MEFKILENKLEKIVFLAKGINASFANAVRRGIQEVPTLAVDEVEFTKNDSALHDDFLAHRIGLIPLKNERGKKFREACSCKGKGCSKCTVVLKLSSKGPGKVYASNIKPQDLIIYKNMPLVELAKDQELEFNAYARLGSGKEHAKFSPGLMYSRPLIDLTITRDCDLCEACVKACPLHLLTLKDKKISVDQIEKCDLCEACADLCNKHGKDAIKLKASEEDIIITLESWGQLTNKEILLEICNILNKNLAELEKQVSKSA